VGRPARYSRGSRRAQRGLAMILAVVVIVTGATVFTVRSFNAASTKADRIRVTQEALARAKAALVAYAIADANRPGELPCPDVNDDGWSLPPATEDYSGAGCVSLIGRLPWATLGLPDLRDGYGERLWYAVSGDFYANGTVALNSDTAYRTGNVSLNMTGTQPAANLIAVIMSAGPALRRANGVSQTRGCTGGTCDATLKCTSSPATAVAKCNPVNYLDIVGGVDNALAGVNYVAAEETDTFNDRLMPVYSDDVMTLVERRAGREIAGYLRTHFDNWANPPASPNTTFTPLTFKGFYPWAGTFNNPSVVSAGVSGTTNGLLPMSAASVTLSNVNATLGTCTLAGDQRSVSCVATLLCIPPFLTFSCALGITGQVNNVGTAFIDPPSSSLVTITGLTLGGFSTNWSLDSTNQRLYFSFDAGSFIALGVATITISAPQASSWTTSSWLATNNWNQVSYYALTSRYALTGANTCPSVTPSLCLGLRSNGTTLGTDNKQAVVITTGRPLTLLTPTAQAQPRPSGASANLANYVERENQSPTDLVFEQQSMRTSIFNDQTAVVRP
jgi:hypothetical protein